MSQMTFSANPTKNLLTRAVQQHGWLTRAGLRERAFTLAFTQLVYPQIWEDPVVDMAAMNIQPDHHMLVIASGGCNALSYLTANPASVTAVDLNAAHVALNRLKQAVFRAGLSDEEIDQFLVRADSRDNIRLYEEKLRPLLDSQSRAYWDARPVAQPRITDFARGFYRSGLLGRFIGLTHWLGRLYGIRPEKLLAAQSLDEQRAIYARHIKPLFEKKLIRALLNRPASLYGLGIPPQQYVALAEGRPMVDVIAERAEKLCCGFDFKNNYFAWQALSRGYQPVENPSLPPFLEKDNRDAVKARIDRLETRQISLLDELKARPSSSLDRYVLLDAQDWMTDADLTTLWREITRTAKPHARVIFRTAGVQTILPGRVPQALLSQWHYHAEESLAHSANDRSAIYGGFHLYELKDES